MVVGSELSEEARPCEVSRSLRVKPTPESFVAAMRGLALSLYGSNLTPSPHEGYIARRRSYRGSLLIRNSTPLGPYSRTMPRALWWS